jgi:predicted histidine transporter YuiF (NhaC family)
MDFFSNCTSKLKSCETYNKEVHLLIVLCSVLLRFDMTPIGFSFQCSILVCIVHYGAPLCAAVACEVLNCIFICITAAALGSCCCKILSS